MGHTSVTTRTVALSTAVGLFAWLITTVSGVMNEKVLFWSMPWWQMVLVAVICEYLAFGVGFRRRTFTFSFGEVSLVIGLLFASPTLVLAGRLLGEFVVLVSLRYTPTKLFLNAANRSLECVVALTVFYTLNEQTWAVHDIGSPILWATILCSVFVAELTSLYVVLIVRRFHGDRAAAPRIITAGTVALLFNTALGLVAAIVATVQPLSLLLVSGIVLGMFVSYRAHESLDKRYASLEMLNEFTRLVSTAGGADSALREMLTYTRTELDVSNAEIWLAHGGEVVGVRSDNGGVSPAVPERTAWNTARALLSPSAGAVHIPPGSPLRTSFTATDDSDVLISPITERDVVVGLIAVSGRVGSSSTFSRHDEQVFVALAKHASTALENSRLVDNLRHEADQRRFEALHDALTGLPNRALFTQVLENAAAASISTPFAAALLDLDGFKEINDTFGHHMGDEVLVEVAHRLRATVDEQSTVARLGGDEFAIVIPTVSDSGHLEALGQRIRTAVARPLLASDDTLLHVGVSVGFALSWGETTEAQELLRRADIAMYTAKTGGGDGVIVNHGDSNATKPPTTGRTRRKTVTAGS